MKRFVKQRDKYGCGPIAIINALKALGIPVSLAKDGKKLYKYCKTLPPHVLEAFVGTHPWYIEKGLSHYNVQVKLDRYPRVRDIEKRLKTEVVILSRRFWNGGHYHTVVGRYGSGFLIANEMTKKGELRSVYRCSRERFKKLGRITWGWFITHDRRRTPRRNSQTVR